MWQFWDLFCSNILSGETIIETPALFEIQKAGNWKDLE